MSNRIKMPEQFASAYQIVYQLDKEVSASGIDKSLFELIKIRASQINKCAFCLDMHTRDARRYGETEERIYLLNAWREATFYTPGERAALALTEVMTELPVKGVPQEIYDEVVREHGEAGTARIIMAITTINAWNRIAISTGMEPAGAAK